MSSQRGEGDKKSRLITYHDVHIRDMVAVTANVTFLYGKLISRAFDEEGMRDIAEELIVDAIPLYRQYMPKDIHNILPNLNINYIERFAKGILNSD